MYTFIEGTSFYTSIDLIFPVPATSYWRVNSVWKKEDIVYFQIIAQIIRYFPFNFHPCPKMNGKDYDFTQQSSLSHVNNER